MPDGHVSDEDYNAAVAVLTADQVSAIAWLATVMNAFKPRRDHRRYPVDSLTSTGYRR